MTIHDYSFLFRTSIQAKKNKTTTHGPQGKRSINKIKTSGPQVRALTEWMALMVLVHDSDPKWAKTFFVHVKSGGQKVFFDPHLKMWSQSTPDPLPRRPQSDPDHRQNRSKAGQYPGFFNRGGGLTTGRVPPFSLPFPPFPSPSLLPPFLLPFPSPSLPPSLPLEVGPP